MNSLSQWKITTVLLLVVIALFSFKPPIRRGDGKTWEYLGSRKVNFGIDRDEIPVTFFEGSFSKLRLKITNGSLNMHKMIVVYGNGVRDEIEMRHHFSKRAPTRIIDLNGNRRVIKKVIFWYDTKNVSNRRATIQLYGRY